MDFFLNALIVLITAYLILRFFRSDGVWTPAKLKLAFRYFTVQSNVFCAFAALLTCLFPAAPWSWLLKYVGTAAVAVTMLTVLLFLGPSLGSYRELLTGADFYMHLVTPLLALLSFCLLERRGMALPLALTGLIPVILYAVLYAYKILLAPKERAWEDFYGFNKSGKWYLSVLAMLTGTFLICLGLMAIQNL